MNRFLAIVVVTLAVILYMLMHRRPEPTSAPPPAKSTSAKQKLNTTVTEVAVQTRSTEEAPAAQTTVVVTPTESEPKAAKAPVLRYKLRNGLIIVQGDIVAGVPVDPGAAATGIVEMKPLKLWPQGRIPYHIQPDVPNPERVHQALAMFANTAVHFTPYNGEADALVFETGEKDCLSYVGKIGGNQPVWISPRCAPADIAHELMHVLGFVHEQNRSDRDNYITVNLENIEDDETLNFEKLPESFMKVSGLGEFDFRSLMMYPPWMFAKNGHSTMESKIPDRLLGSEHRLSQGDINRLNKAYGSQ